MSSGNFDPALDEVGLVVVTYRSSALASFCASTAQHFRHVWVVDNHSDDATAEAFQSCIPHAQVLVQPSNLGFGKANNVGFRAAQATGCSYVLFLNPDCSIAPADVALLKQTLEQHHDSVGLVGARVKNAQGAPYPLWRVDYRQPYRDKTMTPVDPAPGELVMPAYIDGACILTRTAVFARMNGFNEDLFMYCEEDDLGLRLAQQGLQIAVDTRAQACHMGGASNPFSWRVLLRKSYSVRWSRFYMTDRYIGGWQRRGEVAGVLLVCLPAVCIYTLLWRRKHMVKWLGWGLAALDGVGMTKIWRRWL